MSTHEDDPVFRLLDRLGDEWERGEPLHIAAARVFYDAIDDLDDATMTALEAAGFEAVANEGEPTEIRVPSVVRMIEAGRPFDHVEIDPEDRPRVMFLGFLAIVAERARVGTL